MFYQKKTKLKSLDLHFERPYNEFNGFSENCVETLFLSKHHFFVSGSGRDIVKLVLSTTIENRLYNKGPACWNAKMEPQKVNSQ